MPQELDQGKMVAAIRHATGDVFSTMLGWRSRVWKRTGSRAGRSQPTE